MRLRIAVIAPLLCVLADPVLAQTKGTTALSWGGEPWVLAALILTALCYGLGVWRMRQREALDRAVGPREIASFAAGMAVLFAALASPLDGLAEDLFSAHMVQHLLLVLAVPPLVVTGRPMIAFLWALAPAPRKRVGRAWAGSGLGRFVAWAMHPLTAWALFSGAFIFWHLPGPYRWAFDSAIVHAAEHLSLFVSGLMFWTIVIEPSGRRRLDYGASLLFVATAAVLGSLPGALIFLSPRPFYAVHAAGAAAHGMSLLEDQQIAGSIMWIPAGMVYLAAVLWLFHRWLQEAERRAALKLQRRSAWPVAALLLALVLGTGTAQAQSLALIEPKGTSGDAERGAALIRDYGCGACHVVPGITGADGVVGPPLTLMGRRIYIAGMLRNTPDNMRRWLREPQQVVPGNAMPDMGVTQQDARDMAAYLDTLR